MYFIAKFVSLLTFFAVALNTGTASDNSISMGGSPPEPPGPRLCSTDGGESSIYWYTHYSFNGMDWDIYGDVAGFATPSNTLQLTLYASYPLWLGPDPSSFTKSYYGTNMMIIDLTYSEGYTKCIKIVLTSYPKDTVRKINVALLSNQQLFIEGPSIIPGYVEPTPHPGFTHAPTTTAKPTSLPGPSKAPVTTATPTSPPGPTKAPVTTATPTSPPGPTKAPITTVIPTSQPSPTQATTTALPPATAPPTVPATLCGTRRDWFSCNGKTWLIYSPFPTSLNTTCGGSRAYANLGYYIDNASAVENVIAGTNVLHFDVRYKNNSTKCLHGNFTNYEVNQIIWNWEPSKGRLYIEGNF